MLKWFLRSFSAQTGDYELIELFKYATQKWRASYKFYTFGLRLLVLGYKNQYIYLLKYMDTKYDDF